MARILFLDDAELGPIRPGRRFLHRRVIEASTGKPLLCVIICVAGGVVWWRPADRSRGQWCFTLDQITRYVLEMADQG